MIILIVTTIAMIPMTRIQQGSVGRSAPGCQTKLHLQDPADGVGEVINFINIAILQYHHDVVRKTDRIVIDVIRMITSS